MNKQWMCAIALTSSLVGPAWQDACTPSPGQSSLKTQKESPKPAPRIELKLPEAKYTPGIERLQPRTMPLDKYGRPDMQAFQKLYLEDDRAGELALKHRYNMPIKLPDPNVDYKIQIIAPNPNVNLYIPNVLPREDQTVVTPRIEKLLIPNSSKLKLRDPEKKSATRTGDKK